MFFFFIMDDERLTEQELKDILEPSSEEDDPSSSDDSSDENDTDNSVSESEQELETVVDPDIAESAAVSETSPADPGWRLPAGNQPVFPPFTKPSGVDVHLVEKLQDKEPIDFFLSLVDANIFSYIVEQTNLYAILRVMSVMAEDITPASRTRKWVQTDIYEIKRFFGLLLYMGIVRMPSIPNYWSRGEMFKNTFAPSVMSRNRFELLLRMVHFADNEKNVNNDRLHKVQGLLDKILHNFQTAFEPPETVCIDESLIPFRGRLVMRQYLKGKRHRYGIKVFKLCCTNGYTYNMQIYAGKNLDKRRTTPTGVVMKLSQNILNCGRTVVTDNWFTNMDLAKQLLDNQTHLIGTLRRNRRGIPKEVVNKKLKVGECIAREDENGITVLSWRDKRYVLMLSTKHSDSTVEITKRGRTIVKPKIVVDYNAGKSSVDQSDQMASYQTPLRKTIRWHKKLAFDIILNTALVNAWIMFKQVKQTKMKILDFRKAVAYGLCSERPPGPAPAIEPVVLRKSRPRHEIGKVEYKKRKPCISCYEDAKKTKGWRVARGVNKIRTYCKGCPNQPFLCLSCFNKRHRCKSVE